MQLLTLGAERFRNLIDFEIEAHPRFNIFSGANAQGKTNLLEAIYVLGTLKSFRIQHPSELIRFGENDAVLSAHVDRAGARRQIQVSIKGGNRRVRVNGQSVRRLSDYLGTFAVVLFAPEDVSLLKGPPSDRRRFLDRAIFHSRAAYLDDISRYNEVLRQRNALLRDEHPRLDLLDVYTTQLCEHGARVLRSRLEFFRLFRPFFLDAFKRIFGAGLSSDLQYDTSKWFPQGFDLREDPADLPDLQKHLEQAFTRERRHELRRGRTLVGPHRDDFSVLLDGMPVRAVASQGQHRAFVLSLKISEITMLGDRFKVRPLLLLDDVSSELDRERNAQLFEFLSTFTGQVFITTTSRDHILIDRDVTAWTVERGQLSELVTD